MSMMTAIIMLILITCVYLPYSLFQSGVKIGSMQEIWNLAEKGGRIDFEK